MAEERRKFIKIRGANEHNLKNISLEIPRNELVVLTGLSGSGKSPPWHLIQSMQRDRDAIWSPYLPMQDSFWARWKSRMWRV